MEETPREKWVKWGWSCPTHKLDIKNYHKKLYLKRDKPKKVTKYQITERHDIKGVILKQSTKSAMSE